MNDKLLELAQILEGDPGFLALARVAAELRALASEQEPVAGEWEWCPKDGVLYSGDFSHDARLRLRGDFASDADRNAYGLALCAKLNAKEPQP